MSYQHDIRSLGNGHYTVFDNGNYHTPKGTWSRALELELDTLAMTAHNVWEYRANPDIYSRYLGNTQRLPNGNTLINWAVTGAPKLLEVRPDGSKAFELDFQRSADCYRTFRFPWQGRAAVPYLLAESWTDGITLLFNKFGDNNVVAYRIYGGQEPDQLQLMSTTSDPFLHFRGLENGRTYYFKVTAIDGSGEESGYSNQISVVPQINNPGQNVLINGDFSNGTEYWEFTVDTGQANSDWQITQDEKCQITIADQGESYGDIQLCYPHLQLLKGNTYLFEFDAWATEDRAISAELRQVQSPYLNYSRNGFIWLTEDSLHVTHQFIMSGENDYAAAVCFDLGGFMGDVTIDNVSLREIEVSSVNDDPSLPTSFKLYPNVPNPFNPQTTITYQIPEPCRVSIEIYNVLGQKVVTLIDEPVQAGIHQHVFNASDVSSGIYFYKMSAWGIQSNHTYSKVHKMVLLR